MIHEGVCPSDLGDSLLAGSWVELMLASSNVTQDGSKPFHPRWWRSLRSSQFFGAASAIRHRQSDPP
jgi:hypothetical protein